VVLKLNPVPRPLLNRQCPSHDPEPVSVPQCRHPAACLNRLKIEPPVSAIAIASLWFSYEPNRAGVLDFWIDISWLKPLHQPRRYSFDFNGLCNAFHRAGIDLPHSHLMVCPALTHAVN
jgi:hypothetical protein